MSRRSGDAGQHRLLRAAVAAIVSATLLLAFKVLVELGVQDALGKRLLLTAERLPWDSDRAGYYRTIFPQMPLVPEEEAAQLRFAFDGAAGGGVNGGSLDYGMARPSRSDRIGSLWLTERGVLRAVAKSASGAAPWWRCRAA
jgi:hypothetical protein